MNLFLLKIIKKIPVKFKVFLPIMMAVMISVFIITYLSVREGKKAIYESLKQNLELEVQTITKLFEREKELKFDKVKTHINIIRHRFLNSDFKISEQPKSTEVKNQITGNKHNAQIYDWYIDNKNIRNDFTFVDEIRKSLAGTATIFQKSDSGYIRISTNVPTIQGKRAVNTYIPNNSPVIQTIEKGEIFHGRAYVVNDWYITAYEAIKFNEEIVGMFYVGNKEKDFEKLKKILKSLKLSNSNRIIVIDNKGSLVFHPERKWQDKKVLQEIINTKKGNLQYISSVDNKERLLAFQYFPDFEVYICAEVIMKEETKVLISRMVLNSSVIAAVILGVLSIFLFFLTNEGVNRYLQHKKLSKKQLKSTEKALEFSENKFRILFNYSSDEIFVSELDGNIIEVNKVACDSLKYTKEELLKKNFSDIKTDKFKHEVLKNIEIINAKKKYTYETEHIDKAGNVTSSEMKSRLINYNGKPAILSVSRNITQRKELQKKILKTIIETEDKERQRFAADLHDGLSPILSTIRLYIDLLRTKQKSKGDDTELVDNIEELTDLALSSAKEIANNITPQILHDFGLAIAIEEFCGFLKKTKSINIDVDTKKYSVSKRSFSETVLFQTTKELVNNTIKHAEAKNITIELKNTDKNIYLYYRDDGVGFNINDMMNNSAGLGLNNIRNKIKTIKGRCDFNSKPHKGMFVIISVNKSQKIDS